MGGGVLGALAGAAQSLQPFVARVRQEDQVLVGVHTEDLEQADRAQEVLEDLDTVATDPAHQDEDTPPSESRGD